MTRKPAWRYKCDFCGKCGYSGGHMAKHEKHCTMNPARECRMCSALDTVQQPIEKLVEVAMRGGLDALREEADGCAACMLAAIRRLPPLHDPGCTYLPDDEFTHWQFKEERKQVWDIVNDAKAVHYAY